MAGVEVSVDRSQRVVLGGDWWLALGIATIATIAVVALYGYAPSPTSRPDLALRAATKPQIAGLTSVLAKDWGRVRAADSMWVDSCYHEPYPIDACAQALRRQFTALQRLRDDVRAQNLVGTQFAPIVDGRFLHSIGAALAAKKTALSLLPPPPERPTFKAQAPPWTPGQLVDFYRHDADPLVCIEPVGAAIKGAMGMSAGHPLFLSYPHSMVDVVDGGRTCGATG
jgi:hypothetical protein